MGRFSADFFGGSDFKDTDSDILILSRIELSYNSAAMKIVRKGHKRKRNRRSTLKELRHAHRLKSDATPGGGSGNGSALPSQIELPRDFRLSENFSETAGRISALRHRLDRGRGRPPYINFNSIVKVDSAAALMLAAEIGAWNRANPYIKLRSHDQQWDPRVAELLDEMGLFEMLGVPRQGERVDVHERDTVFIPFMHGSYADIEGFYALFLERIEKHMATRLQRLPLIVGMGEAVANAWEHGYKREEGAEWWVSASCNKGTGELKVVCYDRGLTIPGTLPRSHLWENIRHTVGLDARVDCDLIKAALTTRRTKTGKLRRGKGLPKLMLFVNSSGRGELRIYSRRGMVCYKKFAIDKNGEFQKKQLDKPIGGTLIEWRVFSSLPGGGHAP